MLSCVHSDPAPGFRPGAFGGLSLPCRLWLLLVGLALSPASLPAGDTVIEFAPVWGTAPLQTDRGEFAGNDGSRYTVSRLDFLVSDIALQKEDGIWMESAGWQAFLSASRNRLRTVMEGVPEKRFKAMRFAVGLSPRVNSADPNQYPSGHPLHPQENGLHWGWQGGYVFLALEGRVQGAEHGSSGFSYHLGNSENRVWVELPIQLDGKRHRTVRVNFDVARLFDTNTAISPWRDGTSTHSRSGDPILTRLKPALAHAFAIGTTSTDHFQELLTHAATNAPLPRSSGTPVSLQISARLPKVNLPADNLPTLEGVALGRRLFHEARLSRNNEISCASCHQRENAFSDPARFSLGVAGKIGKRHAMPLFNLAWQKEFFWDGRVTGLRHQVLHPIQDTNEMAETLEGVVSKLQEDDGYPTLFRSAFGDGAVTSERIGLALEQFLLTLVSQDSKFDRAARGEVELAADERRGLALFVTENDPARGLRGADCFHCHGGNLFTSGAFANNGLNTSFVDPGRSAVTKNEADRGKFRVPSLRNIAVTAPYMHDGRFTTLEEVVEHYNSGIRPSPTLDPNLAKHPNLGLSLSETDKKDLVAFLRTLTDLSFLQSQTSSSTPSLTHK